MIQDVVTHFVGHDFANFRKGALLEQIIVQRDSSRAEKTGHIRADAIRLTRGVNLENLRDRNFIRAGHSQNRFADGRIVEWFVGVEERFDINRSEHDSEHGKKDRNDCAPDPPRSRGATEHRIQGHENQGAGDQLHEQRDQLLLKPLSEILGG